MTPNGKEPCKVGLEVAVLKDCNECQARKLSLFDCLSIEETNILNRDRSMVTFKSGEYIYREGTVPSGLFCLSTGKVKIEQNNWSGNTHIIALKGPAEFLGFADLMSQPLHTSSAIALEHCTLCFIPKNPFMQVLQSNGSLAMKIIKYLSSELLKAHHRTANLTQKHMRARLAEAIIYVFEKYQNTGSNYILNADLKRSELAALSNMTTANAIRTLSEFSQDQLVKVRGRKIEIIDLPGLRKISQLG